MRKAEQIGEDHDREVLEWKESIEDTDKKLGELLSLKSTLEKNMFVECPPLREFESMLIEKKNSTDTTNQESVVEHEFETLDTSDLLLVCLSSPIEVAAAVFDEHSELISKDSAVECFETLLAVGKKECLNDAMEACELAIKTLQQNMPHGYQIIGDNLDMEISVKHMSSDNKNKSIHMFNMIAIADEVLGNHLSDNYDTTLQDATVADFLPLSADVTNLKKDLIPLWTRVIVNQLKEFGIFKSSVVWHIPHEYSSIMQQPSQEVRTFCIKPIYIYILGIYIYLQWTTILTVTVYINIHTCSHCHYICIYDCLNFNCYKCCYANRK